MGIALDAAGAQRALSAARAKLPPEIVADLPPDFATSAVADDLTFYASTAEDFLANPVEHATTLARDYLVTTVGDFVAHLLDSALSGAMNAGVVAFGAGFPVVGGAVASIATQVTGEAIAQLSHENVDPYLAPGGRLVPEVETAIADWARVEVAAQVSQDLHNMGQQEGGGMYLVTYGRAFVEWNTGFKVRWEHGVYDWAKPAKLEGRPFDPGLGIAGKRFLDALDTQMQVYRRKSANQAQAKGLMITEALRALTAPKPSPLAVLGARAGTTARVASVPTKYATLADYVAFYLNGGTAGRVPPPPPDAPPPALSAPVVSALATANLGALLGKLKP